MVGDYNMKYELNFDKERIAQAKDRRIKHYKGEKVDQIPFIYGVESKIATAWMGENPYTFAELINEPKKCVEGQVLGFEGQCDNFPDSDWIPNFRTFMYGEGFIPSLLGAKQIDGGDMPPFQEGRIMKSIYDVDNLPSSIDEKLGYGPLAKEAMQRMVEAFDGYVPVCITDHQSPYGMATKLMDNEELMLAFYDEPELAHKLLDYCTTAIEDTITLVKSWIGAENLVLNSNVPVPGEAGIMLWDDYISVLTPSLHTEFCKPYNMRLYEKYGAGHLHTCGPYFDGFIDAVVACDPVSIDVGIMRGMSRTREDMLLLKSICDKHNIILNTGLTAINGSVFDDAGVVKGDRDFFVQMAQGRNIIWNEGGSVEKGNMLKEWLKLV